MDQESRADRMEPAGFDEKEIALFWGDGMNKILDRSFGDGLFELFTRRSAFQSDVELGPRQGIGDIPHLGFRFAAKFFRDACWGMDLNGERLRAIEDFDQDGETFAVGQTGAENLAAVVFPELVERFPCVCSIEGNGLGFFAIDDFPSLTVRRGFVRQFPVVDGFKISSAPYALDVKRFESDGGHVGLELEEWKSRCVFQ